MTIQEKWQRSLNSDSTRKFYRLCLEKFCSYTERTPAQLAKLSSKQASSLIESYVLHLKEIAVERAGKPEAGVISFNSLGYYIAGLKSFFDQFDNMKINWKRIKGNIPKNKKVRHSFRSYHLHELRKMLSLADRRETVILLLMISGGLRVGAIAGLKFKDISPSYDIINAKGEKETIQLPHGIATVKVYAGTRDEYDTFITGECVAAVQEYKRYLEEQMPGVKIKPESYLIRSAYENKSVLTGTIRKTIWELFKKTELPTDELQPDHGCRHYFKTICSNAKMVHEWSEAFMGHSQGIHAVYFDKKTAESWKNAVDNYKLAIEGLTITEEARKALSNEIKLQNVPEVERLQAEVEQLKSQRSGIAAEVMELIRADQKAFKDVKAADEANDALLAGIIQAAGQAKSVKEVQELLLKYAEIRGIDRIKAGAKNFADPNWQPDTAGVKEN